MVSLKKRFLFKLFGNVSNAVSSLVIQMVVPRALGPEAYGSFAFLTAFFNNIIGLLDSGTTTGFYTLLSRRPNNKGLVRFYFQFAFVVVTLLALGCVGVLVSGLSPLVWSGVDRSAVLLALGWSVLMWISQIVEKIVDACGLTVAGEKIRVINRIGVTVLIVLVFFAGWLSLPTYFLCFHLLFLGLIFSWLWLIRTQSVQSSEQEEAAGSDHWGVHARQLYSYSSPLIVYSSVVLMAGLAERWLLQRVGGAAQQGFFGLAYQIASICFLFSSAMAPLLMREFSRSFGSGDTERGRELFTNYVPFLYTVAVCLSAFVSIHSAEIVRIVGGKDFVQAQLALGIMALYPMHQTYGQLSNTVLLAKGHTALYRNVGIVASILGTGITVFLVGRRPWGLELGATGLAISTVLVQVVTVNIFLWFNSRLLKMSFARLVFHQVGAVVLFISIAALAKFITLHLFQSPLVVVMISGLMYFSFTIAFVAFQPQVAGLSRRRLSGLALAVRNRLGQTLSRPN